ncbi:hypothetical protein WDU94_011282, partial [Cyamophila willieti]
QNLHFFSNLQFQPIGPYGLWASFRAIRALFLCKSLHFHFSFGSIEIIIYMNIMN